MCTHSTKRASIHRYSHSHSYSYLYINCHVAHRGGVGVRPRAGGGSVQLVFSLVSSAFETRDPHGNDMHRAKSVHNQTQWRIEE